MVARSPVTLTKLFVALDVAELAEPFESLNIALASMSTLIIKHLVTQYLFVMVDVGRD